MQATDHFGHVVAAGEIDRAIVDRDRFLATTANAGAGQVSPAEPDAGSTEPGRPGGV